VEAAAKNKLCCPGPGTYQVLDSLESPADRCALAVERAALQAAAVVSAPAASELALAASAVTAASLPCSFPSKDERSTAVKARSNASRDAPFWAASRHLKPNIYRSCPRVLLH
jgi:hypothetical protein